MQSSLRQTFDLLLAMTEKELKARYKRTVFGFLWVIINPILQMAVIGFIFTFFIKQEIAHYYHFLFTGLLVWNFFSFSLTKATPSIVYERTLIKKASFPRIVIPLSIILSLFVHFLIALLLFFIPLLLIGTLTISGILLLLPVVVWLLFLIISIGLLTTTLNVFYRDVNFFVQALLIVWFYATPIVYPLSFIPNHLQLLWYINPLTSIVQLFQSALLSTQIPALPQLLINGIISVGIFIAGISLFVRKNKYFDDWV